MKKDEEEEGKEKLFFLTDNKRREHTGRVASIR